MWLRRSLVLLALVTTACKEPGDTQLPIDSTDLGAKNGVAELTSPDQSYRLILPGRWAGLIRADTLSAVERGTARPGAMNIVYLPRDSSIIPQTLVVVAVYDSAAWLKVKADGGPPPGDSVLSKNGRVYVLALPQSNPFTPGSIDAVKFDSLALKPTDSATLIRVP
ncbi:MAG: hypothetical protein ABI120_00145 [Gemmatimonadaceae bacterium]